MTEPHCILLSWSSNHFLIRKLQVVSLAYSISYIYSVLRLNRVTASWLYSSVAHSEHDYKGTLIYDLFEDYPLICELQC